MAVDNNLQLFTSANLTVASDTALVTSGSEVELGRVGVGRNAQFVTFVQTAATAASSRDLWIDLELALDGSFAAPAVTGATPGDNTICTIHYETLFKGERTRDIGLMIPWQEYTDADIELRATLRSPSTSVAGDWDKVEVYIGYGETEFYGRAATADTLAPDV